MPVSELLLANVKFLFGWYAIAWIFTLLNVGFQDKRIGRGLPGIEAWSFSGLIGIFFAPFVHGSWGHLRNNTLPFLILGGLVLLRQPIDFIVITITIALFRGIIGWFFGRVAGVTPQGRIVNVRSYGLSGLIYGYAGFLLALFYFDLTIASAIVLAITALLYGDGWRAMLPNRFTRRYRIAWDGHLIGFIVGVFVAAYLPSLRLVSIALLQALNLPTQFEGIMIAGTLIDERFYRQTLPPLMAQYGSIFLNRLRIVLQMIAAAWIIAFVDFQLLGNALNRSLGILPWTLRGLVGIPLAPLLHGDWNHLAGNTLYFLIFAGLIVLVSPDDFVLITVAITLISGLLIWLSAFSLSRGYVGASAVIFGYVGFLLSLFYFENNQLSAFLLVGTILLLVLIDWRRYKSKPRKSSFIRGMLPKTFTGSWGHFLGFIAGVIVAGYLPDLRSYASYLVRTFNLSF
jgi:membrane associated rhomboid family serine protease